mgnify:CR=1 FL=1
MANPHQYTFIHACVILDMAAMWRKEKVKLNFKFQISNFFFLPEVIQFAVIGFKELYKNFFKIKMKYIY